MAAADWVIAAHPRAGFSIEHPADWKPTRGMFGTLVTIAGPELDGFQPNLNVIRRVDDSALDLDGLARSSIDQLSRVLNDPIVVDVQVVELADKAARRMVVAHRQGVFGLTSDQWIFKERGSIWLISSATRSDRYAEHAPVFAGIAASLKAMR